MVFTHEAILETLDWTQYDPDRNEFDYYSVPEFEKNAHTFDNISIYYGQKHPGVYASEEDLLKNEDVVKAGYTSNPNVNMMGRPKLKSLLNITDPAIEDKIRKGEILISSMFRYSGERDGYKTNVTNPCGLHVLLYDKATGIPQGDPGAIICNQSNSNTEFLKSSLGYFEGAYMPTEPTIQVVEVSKLAELLKANQAPVFDTEKFMVEHDTLLKSNQALTTEKEDLIKANQALEAEKEDLIKANQETLEEVKKLKDTIRENAEKVEAEKVELFKANQDRFWNTDLNDATREAFADRKEELYDLIKANQLFQDITKYVSSIPKPNFTKAQGTKEVKDVSKEDLDKMSVAETQRKLAATSKNINYVRGV